MKFRPPCFPWYLHCIRQLESKCLGLALPHLLAKKYEISVIFLSKLRRRVLSSVRMGGGEVVSVGGVFWWKPQSAAVLTEVWEDLVLLLHTMEEKQVSAFKWNIV